VANSHNDVARSEQIDELCCLHCIHLHDIAFHDHQFLFVFLEITLEIPCLLLNSTSDRFILARWSACVERLHWDIIDLLSMLQRVTVIILAGNNLPVRGFAHCCHKIAQLYSLLVL